MIDERSERELVSGGDTRLHHHLEDRATNAGLQGAARQTSVATATYAVRSSDDILLVDTSSFSVTLTLPVARNGREYEFVKTSAANAMQIAPTTGDTVLGSAVGVSLHNLYDALRLKAVSGGWVAI